MSYDLHFECGRKEKHNNWVMHTFTMMLFYELEIWTKDQLEIQQKQTEELDPERRVTMKKTAPPNR